MLSWGHLKLSKVQYIEQNHYFLLLKTTEASLINVTPWINIYKSLILHKLYNVFQHFWDNNSWERVLKGKSFCAKLGICYHVALYANDDCFESARWVVLLLLFFLFLQELQNISLTHCTQLFSVSTSIKGRDVDHGRQIKVVNNPCRNNEGLSLLGTGAPNEDIVQNHLT